MGWKKSLVANVSQLFRHLVNNHDVVKTNPDFIYFTFDCILQEKANPVTRGYFLQITKFSGIILVNCIVFSLGRSIIETVKICDFFFKDSACFSSNRTPIDSRGTVSWGEQIMGQELHGDQSWAGVFCRERTGYL